jgi:hypothetical protein
LESLHGDFAWWFYMMILHGAAAMVNSGALIRWMADPWFFFLKQSPVMARELWASVQWPGMKKGHRYYCCCCCCWWRGSSCWSSHMPVLSAPHPVAHVLALPSCCLLFGHLEMERRLLNWWWWSLGCCIYL